MIKRQNDCLQRFRSRRNRFWERKRDARAENENPRQQQKTKNPQQKKIQLNDQQQQPRFKQTHSTILYELPKLHEGQILPSTQPSPPRPPPPQAQQRLPPTSPTPPPPPPPPPQAQQPPPPPPLPQKLLQKANYDLPCSSKTEEQTKLVINEKVGQQTLAEQLSDSLSRFAWRKTSKDSFFDIFSSKHIIKKVFGKIRMAHIN